MFDIILRAIRACIYMFLLKDITRVTESVRRVYCLRTIRNPMTARYLK